MPGKIRATRTRHGITTAQLAYRLGIQQSTVVRMEQSEEREAITLETLRRAAEALGCEFIYEFRQSQPVPQQNKFKQRSKTESKGRSPSTVGATLDADDIAAARRLSPTQRLQRSMQLSDLIRKLKEASANV